MFAVYNDKRPIFKQPALNHASDKIGKYRQKMYENCKRLILQNCREFVI